MSRNRSIGSVKLMALRNQDCLTISAAVITFEALLFPVKSKITPKAMILKPVTYELIPGITPYIHIVTLLRSKVTIFVADVFVGRRVGVVNLDIASEILVSIELREL